MSDLFQHRNTATRPATPPSSMTVETGARRDLVLYGPRGEVITVLNDRPMLGYARHLKEKNQ